MSRAPDAQTVPSLESDSSLSDVPEVEDEVPKKKRKPVRAPPKPKKVKEEEPHEDLATVEPTSQSKKAGVEGLDDPEAEGDEEANEEELKEALSRPPPVNSDYLPLPWKGRLGYVRCHQFPPRYDTDKAL